MYLTNKKVLVSLASLLVFIILTGWVGQARSQDKFPTRAIDIIIPTAAGGGADLFARVIVENLKKRWNVPINVINKPGGNTVIGNLELHRARPDGYTVMADAQSGSMLLEIASKDLPFKVLDRTFIAVVVVCPHVFYVPSASPVKNLKELEAEARKDPAGFTWSSFGGASPGDFLMRQFFKAIGVDVAKTKPVSARGGSETLTLTAGGHIKLGSGTPASGLPHVRAGTVRVVGVTGRRVPEFPDAPTAEEQGYPAVNAVYHQGISGPPNMAPPILAKWEEALRELGKDQETVSKLKNIGFVSFYLNSHDTKELTRKGMEEARILWGLK
jgi:tripartite-type tricarboxylate transporter receptor subunit TctC